MVFDFIVRQMEQYVQWFMFLLWFDFTERFIKYPMRVTSIGETLTLSNLIVVLYELLFLITFLNYYLIFTEPLYWCPHHTCHENNVFYYRIPYSELRHSSPRITRYPIPTPLPISFCGFRCQNYRQHKRTLSTPDSNS